MSIKISVFKSGNFKKSVVLNAEVEDVALNLKDLLIKSVKKSVKKGKKIGVLFSGGVDSTTICLILKQLGVSFTCYSSGLKNSEDLEWAEKAAKIHGFKLKKRVFTENSVSKDIKEICSIIKSDNPVKVGVVIPFYYCLKQAVKDRVELVFSGLGSEELFAGYQRFENCEDINKECVKGLNTLYERDLERDARLMKHFRVSAALPFLNTDLINYSLKIPGEYKINNEYKKIILRKSAELLGVHKSVAWRKKRAAQYGSKSDKVLERLSKGFESKSAYLRSVYNNDAYGVLFTGGKDSNLALYKLKIKGYNIACLISMINENPDSYMFHQPVKRVVELQSKAMNIPVIFGATKGVKEDELEDLKNLIKKAKRKYSLRGVITGALYSEYQSSRISKICQELSLETLSPLWHMSQSGELFELINKGFKFVFTKVAALGLDKKWLNNVINKKHVDELLILEREHGLNVAGEGGEYESLVLDAPFYNKRLVITDYEVSDEGPNTANLKIKKVKLEKK